MIGYAVYIIMRREVLSGRDTILSLHATFDGAFEAMKAKRDYAIEKGYKIYSGEWFSEVGRRTNKDSAIAFARRCVRGQIEGEVEFKWNVMSMVERWR